MDCSLPGSSIHGILQARILEWVAISFSRGSSQPRDWTQVSCIAGRCFNLCATREVPNETIPTFKMFASEIFSLLLYESVLQSSLDPSKETKEEKERKGKEYRRNRSGTFATEVSKDLTFSCAGLANAGLKMGKTQDGGGMGNEMRTSKKAKVQVSG